jgi:hypothetical protein
MKLNLDIIKEVIKLGTTKYPSLVDPSESDILKNAGVAPVTAHIEKLSLYDLVKDAQPIFGKDGGMWIGYSLSNKGYKCGTDEEYFNEVLTSFEEKPVNEVSQSVIDLAEICEKVSINPNYKEDFIKTLREVSICFQHECFIATIALCGKLLEICLKEILLRNNINSDNVFMLGNLIKKVKTDVPNEYLDPALENLAGIISKSRNTAIHFGERVPIPSRDQAVMVIFATRDVITRNISRKESK